MDYSDSQNVFTILLEPTTTPRGSPRTQILGTTSTTCWAIPRVFSSCTMRGVILLHFTVVPMLTSALDADCACIFVPHAGLQTLDPHRRVVRAREPNADQDGTRGAEQCVKQHGHPDQEPGECWHGTVKRWHKNVSCDGAVRHFPAQFPPF